MTYTDPEIASVGMTEEEARASRTAFRILRWPVAENDRAQAEHRTAGHVKALVTRRGKILGCAIAAAQAGDLIVPWALAMAKGLKVQDLAGLVFPYPTLSEVTKRAAVEFLQAFRREPVAAARHRLRATVRLRLPGVPETASSARKADGPVRESTFGLSARLLVLTVLFVMLAEVLIYVPSVANFRRNWLNDRLAAAQVAALVLDAAPAESLPAELEARLLAGVGARAVAIRGGGTRRLLAASDMPAEVARTVDLREVELADADPRRLRWRSCGRPSSRSGCSDRAWRAPSSSRSCSIRSRCATRCWSSRATS